MRPEQKEQLHEPDGFMKASQKVFERMATMSRITKLAALSILILLVLIAAVAAINEFTHGNRKNIADSARTVPEMEAAAQKVDDPQLLLRLGAAYLMQGTDESLAKSEEVLERALKSAESEFERGMISFELGKAKMELKKYVDAARLFVAAAENFETKHLIVDEANWYAGRCFELLNEHDAALRHYGRVGVSGSGLWKSLADHRQKMLRQDVR